VAEIVDKFGVDNQQVIVTTRVERSDIQRCYFRVKLADSYTKEAVIKISKDSFTNGRKGWNRKI